MKLLDVFSAATLLVLSLPRLVQGNDICYDSNLKVFNKEDKSYRGCNWLVQQDNNKACDDLTVWRHCRKSCNKCDVCKDSTQTFQYIKKNKEEVKLRCKAVEKDMNSGSENYCDDPKIWKTCPEACDKCPSSTSAPENDFCFNSNLKVYSEQEQSYVGCGWLEKNRGCNDAKVARHCPQMCKKCDTCEDSLYKFQFIDDNNKAVELKCANLDRNSPECLESKVWKTCPEACNRCPSMLQFVSDPMMLGDDPYGMCEGNCHCDNQCEDGLFCWMIDSLDAAAPHGCSGSPDRLELSVDYVGFCTIGDRDNGSMENVGDGLGFLPTALPLGLCAGSCKDDSQCGDGLGCWYRKTDDPHPPGCPGIPFGDWNYCVSEEYTWNRRLNAEDYVSDTPSPPPNVRRRRLNAKSTKSTKLRGKNTGRKLSEKQAADGSCNVNRKEYEGRE